MTKLADELLRKQLIGSESWAAVQGMRAAEEPPPYPGSIR